MSTSEPLQKHDTDSDSDSDEEGEEIEGTIPKIVDVDATKLTPLSPEVISKQVMCFAIEEGFFSIILNTHTCRLL